MNDDWLEEFGPRVYRFAWRLTGDAVLAEDLTQETILRAWRERASLRDRERTRVWLFRICANLWKDDRRRQRVRRAALERRGAEGSMPAVTFSSVPSEQREEVQRVLDAMARLPDRQREVLHLAACEQLTPLEIAEVLGLAPGAVRASLSLARQRVRRLLDASLDGAAVMEVDHDAAR